MKNSKVLVLAPFTPLAIPRDALNQSPIQSMRELLLTPVEKSRQCAWRCISNKGPCVTDINAKIIQFII